MGALDDLRARAAGHSAGPWAVEPYLLSTDSRVRVTSPDDGPDYNTAEGVLPSDAELIAAAPKLLAALEAVQARVSETARSYRKTADMLNLQVIDHTPDRDVDAAVRYAHYAGSFEAAELAVHRAIEEALQ